MNDRSVPLPAGLSISAVERDTGLTKDTLRVWERRYGFPKPQRDAFGERAYTAADVDRLRLIRRLMDAGHRPGRIIGLEVAELQALAAQANGASASQPMPEHDELRRYVDLVRAHAVEDLRRALSQAVMRAGLDRFVMEVAAPLNAMIGEAWARGELEIFEEHLYTESMQVVLRNAISNIPQPGSRPRVLLTTFPNEAHGLGLLMAEAILALEGARCLSLGVQTPLRDIVRAAASQRADIVALSFTAALGPNAVLDGLSELRSGLDPAVEIWAGGQCPILQRRPPAGVRVLRGLDGIAPELERWRAQRDGEPA